MTGRHAERGEPRGARRSERGSALLIVFVIAAIIAISLYRELPSVAFEARRQQEQLLVNRGHQYVRAIQLYYRRNGGQFPVSIAQLEKTNNIRYLRRRYVDPFTGKDDWRLLHAGPNGILIDSKVNPMGVPGMAGTSGIPGQTGTANSNGFTGFNSTSTTSTKTSNTAMNSDANMDTGSGPTIVRVPTRPPAIPANGSGSYNAASSQGLNGTSLDGSTDGTSGVPTSAQLAQNPDLPLTPTGDANANGQNGNANGLTGVNGAAAGQQTSGQGQQSGNVMQTLSPVLNNTSGGAQTATSSFGTGSFSSGSTMGQLNGGSALAGVASKARGHTIKLVQDQDNFSLWEFHYDPTQDRSMSSGMNVASGVNQNSSQSSTTNTQSGFSNSFGQSSFGSSNSSNGNTTTQPPTNPQQPTQPVQPDPTQSDPSQSNPSQSNPPQQQ